MKPKQVKQILLSEIKKVSDRADEFCLNPGKCFIRKRKLSFETVIRGIIGMESKSLTHELIDMFDSSPEMPSASAFVQQRSKIKPDAFKTIFESFTSKITTKKSDTLRILAVDGSDVQIATNPGDSTSYHPGSNGQKPYNLLHLNALYDLEHHIYTDAVIQLYAARWGIETSFRDLKYTVGMLDFHSKKVMCIHQEIYAHLIMYNFSEMITSHIVIEKKQRKYTYKANFSIAAHMCRLFYRGKATSPNLETIIARHIIPVRNDRHHKRNLTIKVFHGFLYRVA